MPDEYDIKDEPRESQEDGGEEEVRTAFIPKQYWPLCISAQPQLVHSHVDSG
jgi:hypothetical protein